MREALIDAAIFREWMINIGRRRAEARLAHLLCELFLRHKAVGLVQDHSIPFPITQGELGDAVGFSTVHVNRMLQELRAQNLLSLENRRAHDPGLGGPQEGGGVRPHLPAPGGHRRSRVRGRRACLRHGRLLVRSGTSRRWSPPGEPDLGMSFSYSASGTP